ncbi:MAG: hypothetical protein OJF50_005874 [Nitrospira sp.]|nr:hypothetical protein [Nitrospira sp.]
MRELFSSKTIAPLLWPMSMHRVESDLYRIGFMPDQFRFTALCQDPSYF